MQGASIALNVDRWSTCAMEICTYHNLPSPLADEKFPVGTGSNPVSNFTLFVLYILNEAIIREHLVK